MERLHAVAIAAGMVHSLALMDDGALFYWASADPDIKCQQVWFLDLVGVMPFIFFGRIVTPSLCCSCIHSVGEVL